MNEEELTYKGMQKAKETDAMEIDHDDEVDKDLAARLTDYAFRYRIVGPGPVE